MHNILLAIYFSPPMKAVPCLPFIRIWKVVHSFFKLKVKVPMIVQVIVINIFFFGGCGGSGVDSYLSYSVWCQCWHQTRWRQVQSYFYSRSWDFWINFKFLCTVFFWIYPCTCYLISKSWWDHICFLRVPCMLWMHM